MISKKIPNEPIILGKIGSCYGIYGWIRIFSFTEEAENIFNYHPWFIQKASSWEEIKLESWRYYHQNIIIKLIGIDDRDTANALTNYEIIVDSSQLPDIKDGNFYWKDLIGCRVFTIGGYDLGKVYNIIATNANDVLVIKANLKDIFNVTERLVPFLNNQVIKKVELTTRTIRVDWDPSF